MVKTREPGGTALGEALRAVLLQKDLHVLPLSELLLFMAVRAQHMEEVIMPALARGEIVLCDRFTDATYAYQGYGRGIDLGIIATLNRLVTKGVTPNLTVLLDCEVETGLRKKAESRTRKGQVREGRGCLPRADQAGLPEACRRRPKRFFVVDGKRDVESDPRDHQETGWKDCWRAMEFKGARP